MGHGLGDSRRQKGKGSAIVVDIACSAVVGDMYCLAEFAVSGSLKINLNDGSSGESQGLCLDCVRPRLGSGCCYSCCRLLSWFPSHRDIISTVCCWKYYAGD